MNNTLLTIDNNLLTIYNILIIIMILRPRLNKNFKNKTLFICILFSIFIANTIVIQHYSFKKFIILSPLLIELPIYLAFSSISSVTGFKLIFIMLSALMWNTPVMLFGNLATSLFNLGPLMKIFAHMIGILMCLLIIYKVFCPIYDYILVHLKKGWPALCLIPFSCLLLLYIENIFAMTLDINTFKNFIIWQHTIAILVFFVYIAIIFSLLQIKSQLQAQNELQIFKYQLLGADNHIRNLRESIKVSALQRHDFHHHLQLITTMASENKNEELMDYIKHIEKNVSDSVPKRFCTHEVTNLILTAFYEKAKSFDIKLSVNARIPSKLHILDTDLCVILSNALENAIKATKYADSINKEIEISISLKNNQLFLEIINPCLDSIPFSNGLPISNSPSGGIGTRSIVYVVEKYSGIYTFSANNNTFVLRIII